jgi:hypothetical protein
MTVSPEHKKLEKALINLVESKGFKVQCSSTNGPKTCDKVDDVIPDLRAYSSNKKLFLYGEAETAETIDTDHTKKQIRVLAKRQMKESEKSVPFYLAVPKGSKATAQKVLKDIGYDTRKNIYIVEF